MVSIKRTLEKNCFKTTFSKIRSHLLLKDLDLTEEEIVCNWQLIKQFLDNHSKCGDSQKFCNSLDCHLCTMRISDRKLILQEMSCTKIKNYQEIPPEQINRQIQKLIIGSSFTFSHEDIPSCINTLKIFKNPQIEELIKNIGDPQYKIPCSYIKIDKGKREICILYAFHLVLSGKTTIILKSNELKEICINNSFQFKNEDSERHIRKYQRVKNVENLIILDLGLENETMKQSYYLDMFPEFLNQRKNKSTYIISPILMKLITEELENSKKKSSAPIHKQKINELNNIMESFFSKMT